LNRVFAARGFFTVGDGTDVSPFLSAVDATQEDLPWGALGEMGIAAGRIRPGLHSRIHVHPVVVQVTYLVSGRLNIRMKDLEAAVPYDLSLAAGQAVVTRPGTLLQLRNDSDGPAEVLYIVSPPYVFEQDADRVAYDDAVLIAETWDDERVPRFDAREFERLVAATHPARRAAMHRIALRKGGSLEGRLDT
jgi:mannose-6-phosphate isomerase-like protein (cupin superfamily)